MKRSSNHRGRMYEIPSGDKYPSVTTILGAIGKPALIAWSAKVERELVLEQSANLYTDTHNTPPMSRVAWITTLTNRLGAEKAHTKLLAKAGDIGSQVHSLIEWELQCKMLVQAGPSPHVTDEAMAVFMKWQEWAKSVNLKPIHVEQTVWSRTHGYAGTLDLLAEVDGVETVLDWKTGKSIYLEAHLQNAAYRHAIREMGHGDPKQGMIVRLPKSVTDPGFEVGIAKNEAECMEVFLSTKKLWDWLQENDTYLAKQDEKEAA